ncbi:prealbumin-like fold domain-containing protein, partial [Bifidobacterium longum]|uniref:prealbumin-like fold domain-containing protein n=1 Tax=Bifidobacterium longum TaxID=216816 RepID=UPI0035586BEA
MSASYGDIVDSDGKPTGSKGIVARTAIDELPYGTYEVRETVASAGYLRDASARAWSKRFTIGHDGGDASTGAYDANGNPHRYASLAHVSGAGSASNQVQRADFHFIKKSADTMERMGPIAWRLTSKTTGESHVIVSDKNGELHTKSCDGRFNDSGTGTTGCRPHSRNTNAN